MRSWFVLVLAAVVGFGSPVVEAGFYSSRRVVVVRRPVIVRRPVVISRPIYGYYRPTYYSRNDYCSRPQYTTVVEQAPSQPAPQMVVQSWSDEAILALVKLNFCQRYRADVNDVVVVIEKKDYDDGFLEEAKGIVRHRNRKFDFEIEFSESGQWTEIEFDD